MPIIQKVFNRIIKEYASVTEASLITKIDKKNILKVIQGKRITAGGYHWIDTNNEVKCSTFSMFTFPCQDDALYQHCENNPTDIVKYLYIPHTLLFSKSKGFQTKRLSVEKLESILGEKRGVVSKILNYWIVAGVIEVVCCHSTKKGGAHSKTYSLTDDFKTKFNRVEQFRCVDSKFIMNLIEFIGAEESVKQSAEIPFEAEIESVFNDLPNFYKVNFFLSLNALNTKLSNAGKEVKESIEPFLKNVFDAKKAA